MPRRPNQKHKEKDPTPLDKKQQALLAQADALKKKLQDTRSFLQEAPGLKAEAQRKEQQEILNRFRRPARIEGPSDFRLELANGKGGGKPRTLRHERNLGPMMLSFVLVIACTVIFYYVVQIVLGNGAK
jgi:hypothetical protein